MSTKTVCDGCGAVFDQETAGSELYNIGRHGDGWSEQGHLCQDCVPDEVVDSLERDEFGLGCNCSCC